MRRKSVWVPRVGPRVTTECTGSNPPGAPPGHLDAVLNQGMEAGGNESYSAPEAVLTSPA